MKIIEIKNFTFFYPNSSKAAVKNLSLTVNVGDFLVICGPSGCGKSTLLRHIKPQLAPHGMKSGEILFKGENTEELDERKSASSIGFVFQSPDNQIVTDKVWHELAFGLESLGYDTRVIRRRVAEMASFFGIQNWFHKNVSDLSGGQKQILNLASVMIMQPELLILDEPTSQLDPIAAADFLAVLKKINRELGTTIIISEHRLEEALPLSTFSAVMDEGSLICAGNASDIGDYLKKNNHSMFYAMPAALRIWGSLETSLPCPVSVKEGREFLREHILYNNIEPIKQKTVHCHGKDIKISAKDIWFKYEKDQPDIVCGVNLNIYSGEIFSILGGNGSGKTTTLKLLSGIYKPYRGDISINGKVGFLPQDPQTLFVKKTLYEDILYTYVKAEKLNDEAVKKARDIIKLCRLTGLEDRHPYDLSGGEQQRAAIAKLLMLEPEILLLDEPTKGLDIQVKTEFAHILNKLISVGICIVIVSHDIEFCAQYANRCALFFDGNIVAEDTPDKFFSGNNFYTTSANRIARDIIPGAVTTNDVIESIGGEVTGEIKLYDAEDDIKLNNDCDKKKPEILPLWRKLGALFFALAAVFIFLYSVKTKSLREMISKNGITVLGEKQILLYGLIIICLIIAAVFLGQKSSQHTCKYMTYEKRKLPKRTLVSVVIIILIIPLTLFAGVFYIGYKQYYITAFVILIECMLPFFMIFEGRRPKARELVIISVLCALAVAGRAAFFMLPQFKPVLAIVVIAGVAFGGETGFMVGAITMLVSNIIFSQGPWTPWQMFAMGIIGFLSGVLYKKGLLRRSKVSMAIFGAISAIVIYGGIMNPASALIWGGEVLNINMLLSYYLTGFPMDLIHAASSVVFIFFISEPMLEKLDRIKEKYGLADYPIENHISM